MRITRTGLQWRKLEGDYPPWPVVYYSFRKWQADDTWAKVLAALVQEERKKQGRAAPALAAAIDSQCKDSRPTMLSPNWVICNPARPC